jgi:serine/threonine protein kinase
MSFLPQILMDYCGYGSVRDLMVLTDHEFNEDEVSFIMHQTLRGLVYLHAQNIIHRDVKAANILVSEKLEVCFFFLSLFPFLSVSLLFLTLFSSLFSISQLADQNCRFWRF